MSSEDHLAAFLAEDAAPRRPAPDTAFIAEVMQKVARREFALTLVSAAATAMAAGAVLWACAPALDLAVQALAPVLSPTAGVLALVAAATLLSGRMLARR